MNDREAEYAVQTDYLRRQLAALRKGDRSRWRRFRLLEVACGQCGDTVAEVMDLDAYRVVCTWDSTVSKGEELPIPRGASLPEFRRVAYESAKQTSRLTRRGETMFFPIPSDWQPDEHDGFSTACRHRGWTIDSSMIADALRVGDRKIVVR